MLFALGVGDLLAAGRSHRPSFDALTVIALSRRR